MGKIFFPFSKMGNSQLWARHMHSSAVTLHAVLPAQRVHKQQAANKQDVKQAV
jgi:hypothetical protein